MQMKNYQIDRIDSWQHFLPEDDDGCICTLSKSHGTGAKGSHPEVLEGNINPKNKHFSRWAQKCHKRGHHTQMFN